MVFFVPKKVINTACDIDIRKHSIALHIIYDNLNMSVGHHPSMTVQRVSASRRINASARALFDELDAANRFAVIYRVQQARTPEKRASKIAELADMLARGETIHPRRKIKDAG